MKSNFLKAAEVTHHLMSIGYVGYTPWDVLTRQEADALFNVYGERVGSIRLLDFENGEHKIMAMLLLHWIIEDLPEE